MKDFKLQFRNGVVTGKGTDAMGRDHSIRGVYSTQTHRMAFNKTYVGMDGDDAKEDVEHTVKIRSEYVSDTKEFEGYYWSKDGECDVCKIGMRQDDQKRNESETEDKTDSDADDNYSLQRISGQSAFVNNSKYTKYDNNGNSPFVDGTYSGYYKDLKKYYDINEFLMTFMDGVVTGNGNDTIGDYNIKGRYSDKTQRMAFDQIYADSPDDNLRVRLEYDGNKEAFKGRWYGTEDKYVSDGQTMSIHTLSQVDKKSRSRQMKGYAQTDDESDSDDRYSKQREKRKKVKSKGEKKKSKFVASMNDDW